MYSTFILIHVVCFSYQVINDLLWCCTPAEAIRLQLAWCLNVNENNINNVVYDVLEFNEIVSTTPTPSDKLVETCAICPAVDRLCCL